MPQPYDLLFEHDRWANAEALRSIRDAAGPAARALRVMNHVAGCEILWLHRLGWIGDRTDVWPEIDAGACAKLLASAAAAWARGVTELDDAGLAREVDYVNSLGEPWTSRVDTILLHAVMHSAYHRGQIATLLGQSGSDAAYTDLVHAVRRDVLQ